MSKIAEKRVMELGHFKDPFSREEFTANDVFDSCVECYDQAMQDFMEKAITYLTPINYTHSHLMDLEDFKNYMQDEM